MTCKPVNAEYSINIYKSFLSTMQHRVSCNSEAEPRSSGMPSLQLQPDMPQFRPFQATLPALSAPPILFNHYHIIMSTSTYLHCKLQGISFTAEWPAALVVFEPFPPLPSFPARLASDLLFQHVLVVALKESEASSKVSLMGMIMILIDFKWYIRIHSCIMCSHATSICATAVKGRIWASTARCSGVRSSVADGAGSGAGGPGGPVGSAGVEPCSACFFLKTAWRAGGSVAIWASVKGASKALFVGRLPDAPTLGALGCAIPIGTFGSGWPPTAGTGGAGTAVLLALAAPLAPKPDIADMNVFSPQESDVIYCGNL